MACPDLEDREASVVNTNEKYVAKFGDYQCNDAMALSKVYKDKGKVDLLLLFKSMGKTWVPLCVFGRSIKVLCIGFLNFLLYQLNLPALLWTSFPRIFALS